MCANTAVAPWVEETVQNFAGRYVVTAKNYMQLMGSSGWVQAAAWVDIYIVQGLRVLRV